MSLKKGIFEKGTFVRLRSGKTAKVRDITYGTVLELGNETIYMEKDTLFYDKESGYDITEILSKDKYPELYL